MQFYVIALALIGIVTADVSHLQLGQTAGYSYSSASSEQSALPGGDSSSYQPAHLIPQHLQSSSDSVSFNLGADTQTPEQFIPEADRIAHAQYVQEQEQAQVPGGDSSSYQPEQLIPQHLQAAVEESAQVIPGGDSSSYQPAHLIPQHLQSSSASESFNLGADTQTPEQFIPEADRIAHAQYVQEQEQVQFTVPGGDSSSYQPVDLIPQHLKASHAFASQSVHLGSDTQTPEQYTQYIKTETHSVIPVGDSSSHQSAEIIPGGDASSYQPENLIPQQIQSSSASQAIHLESDNQANYVQQEQSHVVIGANTITPSHLYHEQVSNGIEEFNAETHVPVRIGQDTVTPSHLLPKYSVGSSSSASSSVSTGHDTRYGSNGGYVY